MSNRCEHGLKKTECYVCMSPKKGDTMRYHLDFEKKFQKPYPYESGYRAGWNDALEELLRKIPDVFTYGELKTTIKNITKN